MPIKSEAQRRAMYAAKAGKSTLGIPQKVGEEFVASGPASSKLPTRIGNKTYASDRQPFGSFLRNKGGR